MKASDRRRYRNSFERKHPSMVLCLRVWQTAKMDEATLSLCLNYLEAAESLMIPDVDGWHLARLSHVIEGLKESYATRPVPAAPPLAISR